MISFPLQCTAARAIDPLPMDADDGFARAICGDWEGCGFSLAVRPASPADGPCRLDVHLTSDILRIDDRSRPECGNAIEPSTLAYAQDVADLASGARLDHDAGMWFAHPASDRERRCGQALTLFSTGADGELTIASGSASTTRDPRGDTAIEPINTAPFAVGDPAPAPGTRGAFAPYQLRDPSAPAAGWMPTGTTRALEGLSLQAMLDDPTCLLRAILCRQVVERLTTGHVVAAASLDQTASTDRVASFCDPAFSATVWIERVREGGVTFDQLQYVRATAAQFAPSASSPVFVWPQVRVATLRRVMLPRQMAAPSRSRSPRSGFRRPRARARR